MFSMWLLETIDLGIGKHLDTYLITSVWAPHTHIKQFLLHDPERFHLTRDRQCPNPKYWRCKSHATFLHKSITSTKNMFTYHTQNSMSNKKLHFCSWQRGELSTTHAVRRHAQGTRIKRWPARSAPTSTGDSIHVRNTIGKYCWKLLEAPQQFHLTQKKTAMVLLSPLPLWLSKAFSTLPLVLAGGASSGNQPGWEIILQNRKGGWFSPGLKHQRRRARITQTQFSQLSHATVGPHTHLWMLLTVNLSAVTLLMWPRLQFSLTSLSNRGNMSSLHIYCGSMNFWFCHIFCSSVSEQITKKKKIHYFKTVSCTLYSSHKSLN